MQQEDLPPVVAISSCFARNFKMKIDSNKKTCSLFLVPESHYEWQPSPTVLPTTSLTVLPIVSPSASLTSSSTIFDCEDKDLELGKKKKDCDWIGKPRNEDKFIRRYKRKAKNQIKVWDWCPTTRTCGKVGLGYCPAIFGWEA